MLFVLMPGIAYSWEAATHAYIETHLRKQQGHATPDIMANRVYGANAIDIFNFNFKFPDQAYAAILHDPTQSAFLSVWNNAVTVPERAFAYGFVSHNNSWGMDSTAHISGVTYGRGEGYVIAKARQLAAALKPVLESPEVNLFLPDDVLLNVCHQLVENGVDLLVRGLDPTIGNRLMEAAFYRSDQVPGLLVRSYSQDFAALAGGQDNAKGIIEAAEAQFRTRIMGYGWALMQDNAFDIIAGEVAKLSEGFLGLPPGAGDALVPIVKQGIGAAIMLCATDFERELRADTGWVNGNLSSSGIAW
jgi:hypothetical protein